MIKKILLGFFMLLFGFIGFSNAGVVRKIGTFAYDPWSNLYNINVLKKGTFLTEQIGYTRNLLYLSNVNYWFWSYDSSVGFNNLYSYINGYGGLNQGFVNSFALCNDVFTSESLDYSYSLVNCSEYTIDNSMYISIHNFLEQVTLDDYFYLEYVNSTWANAETSRICFSSSSLGKTLCFGNCQTSTPNSATCSALINTTKYGNTHGSLGFGSGFKSVPDSYLQSSPGISGSIDGSSNTSVNVEMTGNMLYNLCTNGYIIDYLRRSHGSDVDFICFAGSNDTGLVTNDLSGGFYRTNYGMSLIDLYHLTSDGMNWKTWFQTYESDIYKFKGGIINVNPFLSRPIVLYSYFDMMYDNGFLGWGSESDTYDGMGPYFILNYCKLTYKDRDAQYDGSFFSPICDELTVVNPPSGNFNTGDQGSVSGDDELLPPGYDNSSNSSGVAVSVDWSGVLSGDTNSNYDGKNFINEFYQKLQQRFLKPTSGFVGIVPSYILVFMLALILFRFLQH